MDDVFFFFCFSLPLLWLTSVLCVIVFLEDFFVCEVSYGFVSQFLWLQSLLQRALKFAPLLFQFVHCLTVFPNCSVFVCDDYGFSFVCEVNNGLFLVS